MKREPEYDFVDMHCHVLPAVDDGSESMEMTRGMLAIARENHIGAIIVTPHYKEGRHNAEPAKILQRIAAVREAVPGADAPSLYLGNEILYDSTVADKLQAGKICTLAGSDSVLVEFRPGEEYSYLREGLRQLIYAGYRPVLAHCERYDCLLKNKTLAADLRRNGVRLQVNAQSVRPGLFSPVSGFVNRLLSEKLVDFIGTDAHKDKGRAPECFSAWRYLVKKYDPDYVREIMRENAAQLLPSCKLPANQLK